METRHLKTHRDLAIEALESSSAEQIQVALVHAHLAIAEAIQRSLPPLSDYQVGQVDLEPLTTPQVERLQVLIDQHTNLAGA